MNSLARKSLLVTVTLMLAAFPVAVLAQEPESQEPAQQASAKLRRSPFDTARVSLASLPEVQAELKMTDEQKEHANSLQSQYREDVREAFQSAAGDFERMGEEIRKLSEEATDKLYAKLDDGQKQRLTEIYVQANGANALADKAVRATLEISEEQEKGLETAREDNRYAFFDAWGELQGMSEDDRRAAIAELQEEGDEHLLEVLTDEQRNQFAQLSGKELDYDLTPLIPRRGD